MIKVSELLNETIRVAKASPDTIYEDRKAMLGGAERTIYPGACEYVTNNQPSCLVGVAMNNLGITIERLKTFDRCVGLNDTEIGTIIMYFTDEFEVDDEFAKTELTKIQAYQDQGSSWGDSIKVLNATICA